MNLRSRSNSVRRAIALLPIIAVCATCTRSESGDSLNELTLRGADDVQIAAFTDDSIVADEYNVAFDEYVKCLSDAGYEFTEDSTDQFGIRFGYLPDAATFDGTDERCYVRHLQAVDAAWQERRIDYFEEHPAEDPSRPFVVECAATVGVVARPSDGVYDLVDELTNAGYDIIELCFDHGEATVISEPAIPSG